MNSVKLLITEFIVLIVLVFPGNSQNIDTTGISEWKKLYNSTKTWEGGAFNMNQTGHPDYGWGIINMINFNITGDSIYILKILNGKYIKLWIVQKNSVQNVYSFKFSNLDGSEETAAEINCNDYLSKSFIYYAFSDKEIIDREPESDSWDFVLTKFYEPNIKRIVTGFLANAGAKVSVFHAPDSISAADATLSDTTAFVDSIAAIGNSWYELAGMSMVPVDTITYFIKNKSGDIYKMNVTYFESGLSGLGRVGIRKQLVSGTPGEKINDTLTMGSSYVDEVYYNLTNGEKIPVKRANWDIGFKTAKYTASIIANTTTGVQVYTYPKGDISDWNSTSAEDINRVTYHMEVFPLPAENILNVKFDFGNNLPVTIQLLDITGRLTYQSQISDGPGVEWIQLETSSFKPGLYLLRLYNHTNSSVVKILIN